MNKHKKESTIGTKLSLPFTFPGYVLINLLLASGRDKWSQLPPDMQEAHDCFWDDHIDMMESDYWYEVLDKTKKEYDYLLTDCKIDLNKINLPLSEDDYYRLFALEELELNKESYPTRLKEEYEKASLDWMGKKYPSDDVD